MLLFVWLRRRRRMVVKRHRFLQLPFHRFPFVLSLNSQTNPCSTSPFLLLCCYTQHNYQFLNL
jgi:hypothetical protein